MYIYKYIFNSSAVNAADDAASDIVADTNDASVLDESTIDADLTDSQNDELDEMVRRF